MAGHVVVRTGTFAERLAEVAPPVAEPLRRALVTQLHAEGHRLGQAVRATTQRTLANAQAAAADVRTRLTGGQAKIAALEALLATLPRSWGLAIAVGVLAVTCFVVSVAAEYVLNREVIPW